MVIEVVPAELYALAAVLDAAAEQADRSAAAVPAESGSGPVAPAVTGFCETVRTAGSCLGGELRWLGGAVAGAADSWLGLDGSLLPGRGSATHR
jgi:hypothetical protein